MARSDRVAVHATLQQWQTRSRRTAGDIAYLIYASVLVAAIVMVPVIRAAWLVLAEPVMVTALASPTFGTFAVAAALAAMAAVCAPWAAPAVRRAFLARLLTDSPSRFSVAFRGPVVRWWLAAVVATVGVALLCQGVLWSAGAGNGAMLAWTVVSAISAATIAAALAVATQASSTIGNAISSILVALAIAVVAFSAPVGLFSEAAGAVSLAVLSLAAAFAVPWLLDRMHPHVIVSASMRRDATVAGFALMDSATIADAVQEQPQGFGRRLRLPRAARWLTYSAAALVGARRTPARLLRGVALLVGGCALASVTPSGWGLALAAGLTYVGLGACMGGVQQAALAVRTTAVYGVSDFALMTLNTIFPFAVVALASNAGWVGGATGFAVALIVGVASVLARVFASLTPPMPISLLMPVPTPMGDAAALLRLGWALQGVLFAVALSVALLPGALGIDPWRLIWAPAVALALLTARWRTRS